jgi:hypothetical protein
MVLQRKQVHLLQLCHSQLEKVVSNLPVRYLISAHWNIYSMPTILMMIFASSLIQTFRARFAVAALISK